MTTIRQHLVPNRLAIVAPGTNNTKYICIHETANTGRGANANAHARLQAGGNSRQASWHYQLDDKEIVQSYLDSTRCWHAGGSEYAMNSISIEICVNSDGDYAKALANAVSLVQHLMKKHGIPENRIISHKFITGKNCPTNLLKGKSWDSFIKSVTSGSRVKVSGTTKKSTPKKTSSSASKASKSVATMAAEVIAGRHGSGHANRRRSLGVSQSVYNKVRAEVNRRASGGSTAAPKKSSKSVATMATEVIAGKHGSGHANRRRSLGVNQSTYNKVRNEVNRRAGVSTRTRSSKSVATMATEVIAGRHGSGHANRRRSLGVSQSVYNKVCAEVNRRL